MLAYLQVFVCNFDPLTMFIGDYVKFNEPGLKPSGLILGDLGGLGY